MGEYHLIKNLFLTLPILLLLINHYNLKKSILIIITFNLLYYVYIQEYLILSNISGVFILLTLLIFPITLLSNWYHKTSSYYYFNFYILYIILLNFFYTNNLITFYILFEISLFPLFLIIIINTVENTNRYRSIKLLLYYTIIGSFFILISIIIIIFLTKEYLFSNLNIIFLINNYTILLWLLLFIGLSIKIPIYPFHIWLFRAHSEASVSISILLASIILKISTYAIHKFFICIIYNLTNYFLLYIILLLLITLIYSSFSALIQNDIKVIIAISSIAHQSISIMGLFLYNTTNNSAYLIGCIFLIFSHGINSPALFYITGYLLYDRFHSRNIRYYSGLNIPIPIFSIFFLIFILFNLGFPSSANFIGEFFSILGVVQYNFILGFLVSLSIVLSSCYSLILYNRICLNQFKYNILFSIDITRLEFCISLVILSILVITGLFPNII